MRIKLIISMGLTVSLFIVNVSFADIVHFNNGFQYEGKIIKDTEADGYWIDGAFVSESEVKNIEKKEVTSLMNASKSDEGWYDGFFSSLAAFNASMQSKMKSMFKKDTTDYSLRTSNNTASSYMYAQPTQTLPAQSRINYSGTSKSVWQSIRRNTSTGTTTSKINNAGYVVKRERNKDLQELKRNSAAYELKAERQRNKSALGYSKQNSAGYALSRQRAATDRELSSFGGAVK